MERQRAWKRARSYVSKKGIDLMQRIVAILPRRPGEIVIGSRQKLTSFFQYRA
jgi:hypothetical protein